MRKLIIFCMALLVLSCVGCEVDFNFSIGGNENLAELNAVLQSWKLSSNYVVTELAIEGMYAELVEHKTDNSEIIILQLHGGAYIRDLFYRPNLYQMMAEKYALETKAKVLTINYRTAPENPYPAALEDAVKAYNYLLDSGYQSNRIIIAGDSAGGGLTLALTMYLIDNDYPLPKALITFSAWTNLNYRRKVAYVGNNDPKDPYISPYYGDFTGFPPMLMQVGTKDITGDTTAVAKKAKEASVSIQQTTYKDQVHVFQALYLFRPEVQTAWDEVANFISEL